MDAEWATCPTSSQATFCVIWKCKTTETARPLTEDNQIPCYTIISKDT